MERGQFTFYRSYYEALLLLPAEDRDAVFMAICAYALNGEAQTLDGVPSAIFSLIKPTLDNGRKKAEKRKNTGETRDGDCQPAGGTKCDYHAPSAEQTCNEGEYEKESEREYKRENEKESEDEVENEKDSYIVHTTTTSAQARESDRFSDFWSQYPKKQNQPAAKAAWDEVCKDKDTAAQILEGLSAWKRSSDWAKEGGRYIPQAAKFLKDSRWTRPPRGETGTNGAGRQLDDEEKAAIARMLKEAANGE